MTKVVVLGAAGTMGRELVKELLARGMKTIAFGRTKEKLVQLAKSCGNDSNLEIAVGDGFRADEIEAVAKGADVIIHSMGLSYPEWYEKLLPLTNAVMEGARTAGCKVAIVDNIYPYGRRIPNIAATEEHPKQPHTRKGLLRLEMEKVILEAYRKGVPALIARLPDFYGPNAPNTILHVTFEAIAKRKSAMYVGKLDVPREFIYLPDAAKAVVELALRNDAYGESWNIPGAGTITGNELIRILQSEMGCEKSARPIGRKMFALLGLFNRGMREVKEMLYLTEQPFILNGSKYESRIGSIPATPYEQGLRQTIRAYVSDQKR